MYISGKFGDKRDYGGFQREEARSAAEHRNQVIECRLAECDAKKLEHQRKYGARYLDLVRLPYIDLVRMTVIDPMHNLHLGTVKYLFKDVWPIKHNLHETKTLKNMQNIVDKIAVPSDIGRIPRKIEQSFSSFTADQWKNWSFYFFLGCRKISSATLSV